MFINNKPLDSMLCDNAIKKLFFFYNLGKICHAVTWQHESKGVTLHAFDEINNIQYFKLIRYIQLLAFFLGKAQWD